MTQVYAIAQWIFYFFLYCFLGWIFESIYVSLHEKRLVNRGFMKGPCLPIYGSGAIGIIFVTMPLRGHVLWMSLAGMMTAAILEYVTGAVMERLFRVRYWDYTGRFLNINGYICAASVLCWGFMTFLVVDVIQEALEKLAEYLGMVFVNTAVVIWLAVGIVDFITSFRTAIHLRDILIRNEKLQQEIAKLQEKKKSLEREIEQITQRAENAVTTAGAAVTAKAAQMSERAENAVTTAGAAMTAKAVMAAEKAETLRQELTELTKKLGENRQAITVSYKKEFRELLLRNPSAVSFMHKETFVSMKNALLSKMESGVKKAEEEYHERMGKTGRN